MEGINLDKFNALSKEQMLDVNGGKWGYHITSIIERPNGTTVTTWKRYNIFGKEVETGESLNNDE